MGRAPQQRPCRRQYRPRRLPTVLLAHSTTLRGRPLLAQRRRRSASEATAWPPAELRCGGSTPQRLLQRPHLLSALQLLLRARCCRGSEPHGRCSASELQGGKRRARACPRAQRQRQQRRPRVAAVAGSGGVLLMRRLGGCRAGLRRGAARLKGPAARQGCAAAGRGPQDDVCAGWCVRGLCRRSCGDGGAAWRAAGRGGGFACLWGCLHQSAEQVEQLALAIPCLFEPSAAESLERRSIDRWLAHPARRHEQPREQPSGLTPRWH